MSPYLYLMGLILMTINRVAYPEDWLAYISYLLIVIGGIGAVAREFRINPDAFIEGEPLLIWREHRQKPSNTVLGKHIDVR